MRYQSISKRFDPIPVVYEGKSKTVPDMSFTPREIIQKFSRGEKVPLGFASMYDSEDESGDENLRKYDPAIFEDDPTRDPEFDFGEYVEEKHSLEQRQREEKRRSRREAYLASQRKASFEESSASEATRKETTSGEANKPSSTQVGESSS